MGIFSRIPKRIANWYRGPFVPPDNSPGSLVARFGHHEPPLLAKILRRIGRIVATDWKWLIGTAIAIVAIVLKFHA